MKNIKQFVENIKQVSGKKDVKGSSSLIQKLLQIKGVEREEIEKLYSKGLMDPETLKDLTLDEMVKASGIKEDFAVIVKEVVSRKESSLPFEYKKVEIGKIKKEKKDVLSKTEYVLKEIEQLKNEHGSLQEKLQSMLDKNDKLTEDLEGMKEEGTNHYFEEKRVQDVVMFMVNEQKAFKQEVDRHSEMLESSKIELGAIKKEYMFTKGECDYITEKIDYLVKKLDIVIEGRGLKQDKLTSFLNELRHIRNNMVQIHKKSRVEYYVNK